MNELVRLGRKNHPRIDDGASFIEDFEATVSGKMRKIRVCMTLAHNYMRIIDDAIVVNRNEGDTKVAEALTYIRYNVLGFDKFVGWQAGIRTYSARGGIPRISSRFYVLFRARPPQSCPNTPKRRAC